MCVTPPFITLTLLFLHFDVFHIGLSVFLFGLQLLLLLPVFLLEVLRRLGLHRLEGRGSEECRWLRGHRSLLLRSLRHLPRLWLGRRRWRRLGALLRNVGERMVVMVMVVVIVMVVVAVLVAVQDMFARAEVVWGFGVRLQLMRLEAPVLWLVMELHFLRVFLGPLPLLRRR